MEELGKVLRARREDLGLSVEDMEQRTKIRKRYLEALEEGDWDALPGQVYARGFVRSYAEHVGLDGHALLQEHAHSDDVNAPPATTSAAKPQPRSQVEDAASPSVRYARRETGAIRPPRVAAALPSMAATRGRESRRRVRSAGRGARGWLGQAVAVVAILAVLGGAWYVIRPHGTKSPTAAADLAAGEFHTHGKGVGGAGGDQKPQNATGAQPASGTHKINPSTTTPVQPAKPAVQVTALPLSGSNLTYDVKTNQPLHVVLSTSTRLWTLVKADGAIDGSAGGEIIGAGTAKTYTANQSLTFTIGNVPVASFVVNGQPVTLPNAHITLNISFVKVTG